MRKLTPYLYTIFLMEYGNYSAMNDVRSSYDEIRLSALTTTGLISLNCTEDLLRGKQYINFESFSATVCFKSHNQNELEPLTANRVKW